MTIEKMLVIVDMLNDFVENRKLNGKDYRNALTIKGSAEIIYNNKALVNYYSKKGNAKVIFIRDAHYLTDPVSLKEFSVYGEHCVINTFGAELIEELKYKTVDIGIEDKISPNKILELSDFVAFEKNATSMNVSLPGMKFFSYLFNKNPGIEVYITGLISGICVKDAFNALKELGYKNLFVVKDATKGLTIDGVECTAKDLEELSNNGARIITAKEAMQ